MSLIALDVTHYASEYREPVHEGYQDSSDASTGNLTGRSRSPVFSLPPSETSFCLDKLMDAPESDSLSVPSPHVGDGDSALSSEQEPALNSPITGSLNGSLLSSVIVGSTASPYLFAYSGSELDAARHPIKSAHPFKSSPLSTPFSLAEGTPPVMPIPSDGCPNWNEMFYLPDSAHKKDASKYLSDHVSALSSPLSSEVSSTPMSDRSASCSPQLKQASYEPDLFNDFYALDKQPPLTDMGNRKPSAAQFSIATPKSEPQDDFHTDFIKAVSTLSRRLSSGARSEISSYQHTRNAPQGCLRDPSSELEIPLETTRLSRCIAPCEDKGSRLASEYKSGRFVWLLFLLVNVIVLWIIVTGNWEKQDLCTCSDARDQYQYKKNSEFQRTDKDPRKVPKLVRLSIGMSPPSTLANTFVPSESNIALS